MNIWKITNILHYKRASDMAREIDVSVNLCGIKLKNPTMLASGVLGGTAGSLRRIAQNGAGALITKSIGVIPRNGYQGPTVIEPMENVLLNAMGLPNPGYKEFINELNGAKDIKIPIIPSVFGSTEKEFVEVAKAMEKAGSKMLEVNISCPHPDPKCRHGLISQDPDETKKVVTEIKKAVKIPIIVKLSPNVTDISEFAEVAVNSGANAISAINTIQALEIHTEFERPTLGNLLGGQSGASIRPIALRKVADIILKIKELKQEGYIEKEIPVIGIGGVTDGLDIVRFLLVGASCVQIGTAVKDDLAVFDKSVRQLKEYMIKKKYESLDDFRGNALKWLH